MSAREAEQNLILAAKKAILAKKELEKALGINKEGENVSPLPYKTITQQHPDSKAGRRYDIMDLGVQVINSYRDSPPSEFLPSCCQWLHLHSQGVNS